MFEPIIELTAGDYTRVLVDQRVASELPKAVVIDKDGIAVAHCVVASGAAEAVESAKDFAPGVAFSSVVVVATGAVAARIEVVAICVVVGICVVLAACAVVATSAVLWISIVVSRPLVLVVSIVGSAVVWSFAVPWCCLSTSIAVRWR